VNNGKKKVRTFFLVALWAAFLIYVFGMTYLMAGAERRLGQIEHWMAHRAYGVD